MYRIEGLVRGIWDAENVGGDSAANSFTTRAEATVAIADLARLFSEPESDFRIVEV